MPRSFGQTTVYEMEELPPPDHVDEEGHRYHSASAAARIIGPDLTCEATMRSYARAGEAPCGLDLCVIKQPYKRTGHTHPSRPTRTHRDSRLLLREDRILALRELLQDHRQHRRGLMSDEDLSLMRDAALRLRLPPRFPKLNS